MARLLVPKGLFGHIQTWLISWAIHEQNPSVHSRNKTKIKQTTTVQQLKCPDQQFLKEYMPSTEFTLNGVKNKRSDRRLYRLKHLDDEREIRLFYADRWAGFIFMILCVASWEITWETEREVIYLSHTVSSEICPLNLNHYHKAVN